MDHARQGARLRPGGAVLSKIFGGESAGATGVEKRAGAHAETEGCEKGFRQPGKLKKEDIPASEHLAQARPHEFAHHRGVRDIEDYEFGDALRMNQRRTPCDGSAPIVTYQEEFLPAELICNSNQV